MAYIEAKGIYKTFGKGDAAVHALRGASLSADKGEMVAVMGKSGSGKSTLLNILGGLMTMDEGELYVGGEKVDFQKKKYLLNYRRKEVGFVVQYFALIEDMNIYRNVALPLKYQGMGSGKIRHLHKRHGQAEPEPAPVRDRDHERPVHGDHPGGIPAGDPADHRRGHGPGGMAVHGYDPL